MTTPGGRAERFGQHGFNSLHVLGAPASIMGSERPQFPSRGLRPFALPHSHAARLACADLLRMGDRQSADPPSPSLRLSKHRPSVKKSSIWSRKKSPIRGMCSYPPRYYNPINRQAGCPLNLPPPRAARLFCCHCRHTWSVWTGAMPFPRELPLLEVRYGLGVVALCL